jgi:tetratricopeptide (TPR) repeat protein
LYPEDLRMLFATFLSEFHGATLWHGDGPDLILMAPTPPSSKILERAQRLSGLPRPHEDFAQLGMEEAAGIFGFYLLDDRGLRDFSAGAQINTDDRTILEYHAPRSLLVHGLEDSNRDALLLKQKNPLPDDLPAETRDAVLAASAATSINQEDAPGAERFLRALDNRPVTARIAGIRGRAALAGSNFTPAYHAFGAALAIDPNSTEAAWGLAETDRRFGNNEKARQELQRILTRDPQNIHALESLEKLESDFSRWPEAEDLQRQFLAAGRPSAAALAQLAEILQHENKPDEAYRAMQDCLALDPYNFQSHLNLGKLLAGQTNWAEARRHLEFVMRYFPDEDAAVYPLLFQADQALGDPSAAAKAARFGLRLFPDDSELQRLNLLIGKPGLHFSIFGL